MARSTDWKQIREVFEQVLDRAPSARAAFLDEACAGDPALRREVEALLGAHDRPGGFLTAPAQLAAVTGVWPSPTASADDNKLDIGVIVDGKYRVEALLGTGGMGAVYRATHVQLERSIALKVIREHLLDHPQMTERFRREALAVARLRHPNIVTVHDYGVAKGIGAYLVLELLEGHPLRNELARQKRLGVATALELMSKVCGAVEAAHRAGVIHRDLKPENIFLEKRGEATDVKVLDFGLAKLEAFIARSATLTARGAVIGTPVYMSPEQCRAEAVDARSDVYALGCVLYEMLTGRPPFVGQNAASLVHQHVAEPPVRPSTRVPEIPPDLDEALLRALAKKPGDRYQTVADLEQALHHAAANTDVKDGETLGGPPAVPASAPTPAQPSSVPPNNLPRALTRFVGRHQQIDDVRDWLKRARLVTLVGPGGIGKTRLSLEVAAGVLGDYPDGVWFVALADVGDPEAVVQKTASVLGVREQPGRPLLETLGASLHRKQVLLVLDNCEHVVEACARLAQHLLESAQWLHVLATSREALAVAGEAAWPVPALALPLPDAKDALDCEAVRLFVDRAALARPGFEVTESTAPLIATLCRQLEGIPLAIELAAARAKAIPIEQILERLDDRFRLLTGGSRTAPERQQTLRATLDWSHDLLTDEERALLRRLAVFSGGWTLDAAEEVCRNDECGMMNDELKTEPGAERSTSHIHHSAFIIHHSEVLDVLSRLVDKSLVVMHDQSPDVRYTMLESIRVYTLEHLRASGEMVEVSRRHAEHFLALAERESDGFVGPNEARSLARLEAEHENLKGALEWFREHAPEEGLRLTVTLLDFWSLRGHYTLGRRWMTAALDVADSGPSILRVKALRGAGEFAWRQGDAVAARELLEQSLALVKETGDVRQIGWSGFHLAIALQQHGDLSASREHLEESLNIAREIGNLRLCGNALNSLGEIARMEGEWEAARQYYEQALAAHRSLGHPVGVNLTLCNMGAVLCELGDLDGARSCLGEALPALHALGNTVGISLALDGLGALATKHRDWERAARLAGAAEALRAAVGSDLEPSDRGTRERSLAVVRGELGEAGLEAALAEGRAMELERVIEYVISRQ